MPRPILLPNFGPAAGGTKIRIQNLGFDDSLDLSSAMKIVLGKKQCDITVYDLILLFYCTWVLFTSRKRHSIFLRLSVAHVPRIIVMLRMVSAAHDSSALLECHRSYDF